ncbi:MAG: hypothetical protein ABJA74_03155 [Lapillicoccus sp.]
MPAAAAQHLEVWEGLEQRGMRVAPVQRVALVELRRLVQLGV